ncbi:MAG: hypothetical protein AAF990_01060 [Bacteroidota bacterium]
MKKILFSLFLMVYSIGIAHAQGFAFGVKGGLTAGFQQWNNFERDPLLSWHGIAFIESLTEDNAFSLFAQAGFHNRGSAIRIRSGAFRDPVTGDIVNFRGRTTRYEFYNASLSAGGKQKFALDDNKFYYYMIGIRGDYNLGTNLDDLGGSNVFFRSNPFFPQDGFVRDFTFGFILGGGLEFQFQELIGGLLEVSINPDFTKQYEQPPIRNVYNPFTGNNDTLGETSVRNITIEISLGIRLLNKVEYID